jgi:hypothetical protein
MHTSARVPLLLLCLCLTGCLSSDPEQASELMDRLPWTSGTLRPDSALLDFAVVEQPLGEAFLNEELWRSTDNQVVGLETKPILDDNGFWVGQVIGMNPAKLQELIESTRYCVTSRRQILSSDMPTVIALGSISSHCSFRLRTERGDKEIECDQAEFTLVIVPSLTNDGRTRLKFTPQILYGSAKPDVQVSPDRTGFLYERKRPSKSFEDLSWTVTLAPNQYLVVGTHFDQNAKDEVPLSLGNECFLQDNGRQRLLVIRTARGGE